MDFDDSRRAIYIQISDRICDAIMRGDYDADGRLPSVRDYAAEAEVNANTLMRSYDRLAADGLIYNRRGIGFFVAPEARLKIIRRRTDELINTRMPSLFDLMMHLGISPQALAEAYQSYIDNHQTPAK